MKLTHFATIILIIIASTHAAHPYGPCHMTSEQTSPTGSNSYIRDKDIRGIRADINHLLDYKPSLLLRSLALASSKRRSLFLSFNANARVNRVLKQRLCYDLFMFCDFTGICLVGVLSPRIRLTSFFCAILSDAEVVIIDATNPLFPIMAAHGLLSCDAETNLTLFLYFSLRFYRCKVCNDLRLLILLQSSHLFCSSISRLLYHMRRSFL